MAPGRAGAVETVMVMPLDVAVAALRQPALLVITQVITLLLAKAAEV